MVFVLLEESTGLLMTSSCFVGDDCVEELLQEVIGYLENLKVRRPEVAHLISGGMDLI